MILVGESDDWTPAAPCHELAARFPGQIVLATYPGAYHDFDAPGRTVEERSGLATPPSGTGHAHIGTNEPARQDALRRVPGISEYRTMMQEQTTRRHQLSVRRDRLRHHNLRSVRRTPSCEHVCCCR